MTREKNAPRTDDPTRGTGHLSDTDAPSGNAVYDPAQQSHRQDMPDREQDAQGEPMRGTAPPGSRRMTTEPTDEITRARIVDEGTAGR